MFFHCIQSRASACWLAGWLACLLVCVCMLVASCEWVNVMCIHRHVHKHVTRRWLCLSHVWHGIGASVILHLYMFFCSFSRPLSHSLSIRSFSAECLFWSAYQLIPLTKCSQLSATIANSYTGEQHTPIHSHWRIQSLLRSLTRSLPLAQYSHSALVCYWYTNENTNHIRLIQFNVLNWTGMGSTTQSICFLFRRGLRHLSNLIEFNVSISRHIVFQYFEFQWLSKCNAVIISHNFWAHFLSNWTTHSISMKNALPVSNSFSKTNSTSLLKSSSKVLSLSRTNT